MQTCSRTFAGQSEIPSCLYRYVGWRPEGTGTNIPQLKPDTGQPSAFLGISLETLLPGCHGLLTPGRECQANWHAPACCSH